MTRKELQTLRNKLSKTGVITQYEVDGLFKLISMLLKEVVDLQERIDKLSHQELFDDKQKTDKIP